MKHLFLYLSVFLLFTNCKKSENRPKNFGANAEITEKIDSLYAFDKSSLSCSVCTIPKNLFSSDLEKILNEANTVSRADAERIKNSDYPTDKPMMLEGSTFTGVYEGFTKYKLKTITVTGNKAEAIVAFEYDHADPKAIWNATVSLINEKGWKVDNIIFSQKTVLKNQLNDFIVETKKGLKETVKK